MPAIRVAGQEMRTHRDCGNVRSLRLNCIANAAAVMLRTRLAFGHSADDFIYQQ